MIHSRHRRHRLVGLTLRQRTVSPWHVRSGSNAKTAAKAGSLVLRRGVTIPQDSHAFRHACSALYALPEAGHRTYIGRHLVHHVVGKVTMEHPVAEAVGDEFDVACLCYPHQRRVASGPGRLLLARALAAGLPECEAVEMDRVMIHAQVDKPDPHAFALTDDKRRRSRAGFPIERKPVELHVHAVRNRAVGKNRILLQRDQVVLIDSRRIGVFGVDDEPAEQPNHFLHRHVRVIEEGAVLV